MSINLKKKGAGLNLIKEIISKNLSRKKEIEQLNKLNNPYSKLTRPK
jgi:hypothetical protein